MWSFPMWQFPDEDKNGEAFNTSPSFATERFSRQIEEILWCMGHPNDSINDDTQFTNFYNEDTLEWDSLKDHVKEIYQIDLELEDHLWEAGEKLYENGF